LTLLVLQTSFLVPPFGYAVMMARTRIGERLPMRSVARGIAPYLCAQLVVLGVTIAVPELTHLIGSANSGTPPLTDEQVRRQLESIRPIIEPRD